MRLGFKINFFHNRIGTAPVGTDLSSIQAVVTSGHTGVRRYRVYLDGDTPGAFVVADSAFGYTVSSLAEGLYVVEFKDDTRESILAKVYIYDYANTCYNLTFVSYEERQSSGYIQVDLNGIYLSSTINFDSGGISRPVRNRSGSIDGGATYKALSLTVNNFSTFSLDTGSTFWSNSELAALGYTTLTPTLTLRRDISQTGMPALVGCIANVSDGTLLDHQPYPNIVFSHTKTDCTATDAADGTITVEVSGGSGSFSFLWSDGVTTQNRGPIDIGTYSVVITDDVTLSEVEINDIVITEPQPTPEVVDGTLLEFPLLNDFHFVTNPVTEPDDCDTFQQLDNVLLKDQVHGAYQKTNYFQKVAQCDINRTVQFNSDFTMHTVELFNYVNDLLIKSFTVELKEQNIGVSEDHQIRIENHTVPGQSRVYFQVGTAPIPLIVGQTFQVVNSADGFNGVYSIVDIILDPLVGYSYLLINKNYAIGDPTSAATGRFVSDAADFNVFESILDFSDIDKGCYYIKVTATNLDAETIYYGISEPIEVRTKFKNVLLIEARNFDNAMDVTWTTGYVLRLRIEGVFGPKRFPGGERSLSRDADYSLSQTSAKKIRGLLLETGMLPPYMHEKLSCLFDLDFKTVNKVEVATSEGYADPEYKDKVMLSQSSIKLEQVPFFKRYNSNDIGTINDSGFITTETGFLKR